MTDDSKTRTGYLPRTMASLRNHLASASSARTARPTVTTAVP